jgi:hypothetical protein
MSDPSHPQVEAAVALVTNPNNHILLVLNEHWGKFSLPISKRRRGKLGNEQMPQAAMRAAVEALGVPVRLVEGNHKRLPVELQSGRQMVIKNYSYDVYHVEAHPDFVDRLHIRAPHLWLSPHLILSGVYEPISESARIIVRSVLKAFEIPARQQHTSTLMISRSDPERGLQFLLRRHPDWGYALPAKRWDGPDPATAEDMARLAKAAAERVVRDELGLEPGKDLTLAPAEAGAVTTHGFSKTKGAPAYEAETDYIHSLFEGSLRHPEKLHSDRALAWVTAEEIRYRRTGASHVDPGSPQASPGQISRTAYEILVHMGLIPEADDREIAALAEQEIARRTAS